MKNGYADMAAVVAELNGSRDEITELWKRAELILKSLGYHRDVWVRAFSMDGECELIGFIKIRGKWRICTAITDGNPISELTDVDPIVESSLETRVAMIEAYPRLRQEIIDTMKLSVGPLKQKVTEFKATLDRFETELL